MATAIQMDERIIDYLVLGPNIQDRKVSAKSVTMRATALCKNLSGYRELLLNVRYKCRLNLHLQDKRYTTQLNLTLFSVNIIFSCCCHR